MLKRIDLIRDYQKHKKEYLEAIETVCEETAFSGGKFADQFDREFARPASITGLPPCTAPCWLWVLERGMR